MVSNGNFEADQHELVVAAKVLVELANYAAALGTDFEKLMNIYKFWHMPSGEADRDEFSYEVGVPSDAMFKDLIETYLALIKVLVAAHDPVTLAGKELENTQQGHVQAIDESRNYTENFNPYEAKNGRK
ncbi:hypothetical protein [Streptomyces sp. NPDC020681]|uniref:hypothetical protein n=1 Tax=Streptomyces sp. NPDC020681 TaxID=3365083 RepID=UPI0037AC5884